MPAKKTSANKRTTRSSSSSSSSSAPAPVEKVEARFVGTQPRHLPQEGRIVVAGDTYKVTPEQLEGDRYLQPLDAPFTPDTEEPSS